MSMSLTHNATQATQVEQVRAAAEVAAAIQVAQQFPRTPADCLAEFLRSCDQKGFAEDAFYRYRRGTEAVTGVTIGFAQEAARCWRNMQSGSVELTREATWSEVIAFAWDVQMNTRRSSTFYSPHQGYTDTPKKDDEGVPLPPRKLVAVRDIRENNASASSRVEREMILAVLPTWYVTAGKDRCRETLAKDDSGKPIEVRRQMMIDWFADKLGVRRTQLEEKLVLRVDDWTNADLAQLSVIGKSIKAGEQTLDAEFPKTVVHATGTGEPAPGAVEQGDAKISSKDQNEIFAILGNAGIKARGRDTDQKRHHVVAVLLGKPVDSFKDLSRADGVALLEVMRKWGDGGDAQVAELLGEPYPDPPAEPGAEPAAGPVDLGDDPDGDMADQETDLPRDGGQQK